MNTGKVGETQDKDFEWVSGQLAAAHCMVEICETVFCQGEDVTTWVCRNNEGRVMRKTPEEEKVRSVSKALEYFFEKRKRENGGMGLIAYAGTNSGRIPITTDLYEELVLQRGFRSRYRYLQSPCDSSPSHQIYLLRFESKDNLFHSSFSIHKKSGLVPAHDLRLYYKMLVPCRLILESLQMSRKWKVWVLEIELSMRINGDPVIIDTRLCRVERCLTAKTAYFNSRKSRVKLRVQTPANLSKDKSMSDTKVTGESDSDKSILPTVPRLAMNLVPHHSDFKELLVRKFAKTHRKVIKDIDELYTEMEEKLLNDGEVEVKMKRRTRKEGSMKFEVSPLHLQDKVEVKPLKPQVLEPAEDGKLQGVEVRRMVTRMTRVKAFKTCSSLDRLLHLQNHREKRLSTERGYHRSTYSLPGTTRIYRFTKTSHYVI